MLLACPPCHVCHTQRHQLLTACLPACLQTRPNPKFTHLRGSCDVTDYAATYVRMSGASPYSNRDLV